MARGGGSSEESVAAALLIIGGPLTGKPALSRIARCKEEDGCIQLLADARALAAQ